MMSVCTISKSRGVLYFSPRAADLTDHTPGQLREDPLLWFTLVQLAELPGGTLRVKSTQGTGSTFTLALPVSVSSPTAEAQGA